MPIVKCKNCKNEFYAKPNWLKKGLGKFCSSKCHHETLKRGKMVKCFICNKSIYKSRKALNGSKSKKYFCGKSCQTIWRNSFVYTGKNHPNWKDGRFTYRTTIEKSNKPVICVLCKIEDKRTMLVHHLDEKKNNNKISNLVWLCHNCHFLVHNFKTEKEKLQIQLKSL